MLDHAHELDLPDDDGLTHAMKKAGYVVTLVPTSTAMYSGEADTTPKQVMRNEYASTAGRLFWGRR